MSNTCFTKVTWNSPPNSPDNYSGAGLAILVSEKGLTSSIFNSDGSFHRFISKNPHWRMLKLTN
ncbi:hypothetical protein [Carboxylicivirga sp. N1Y90]|uniref:hypothetical protein n=1 Tax=Carboxylicivirga fragile TaxID=3417571 RepID=UPI003D358288|nr:hypothetical protein [Marinilabiliaceae bacterium N1Y90]